MDLFVKNYMEDMVLAKMPQVMAQMGVCHCEKCKLDIFAFVLNKMPPKYVVTQKGTVYAKLALLQSQFDVDIITQITHAAEMVMARPRHGESE
ncbi:MAG: late competence development ComFB family protein [Defluviitaleaceae bacterium]|nr:late competence development ComFB family protein [Defluviitaleaceae bacterium]